MAFIDIGEIGVYLDGEGTQSGFRIGFRDLIFIVFNRLAAFEEGSVTYQKRPLGLDNCAN
jgi:hypothetical protein